MHINIALDGPSGAGKSSVAKIVAKSLGYLYLDTGALYRTIALYCLENSVDEKDAGAVTAILDKLDIKLKFEDGTQKVLLCGRDVSDDIRKPPVSMAASAVSAHPPVREFLLSLQRDIAAANNCIMDGRDIGTVVLPNAQIKIFLTASPEIRATRRYKELVEKGFDVEYDKILEEIKQRDYNDQNRAIAPLRPADDAILVDDGGKNLQESADGIINLIKEKLNVL